MAVPDALKLFPTRAIPRATVSISGSPLTLSETQQTLVLNRLRGRITVQVDGQMKTGEFEHGLLVKDHPVKATNEENGVEVVFQPDENMFGNYFYMRHTEEALKKAESVPDLQRYDYLRKKGGTSVVAILILYGSAFCIGILLGLLTEFLSYIY